MASIGSFSGFFGYLAAFSVGILGFFLVARPVGLVPYSVSTGSVRRINIAPEQLNIGSHWDDEHLCHSFTVMNDGLYAVSVARVVADCSCTEVEPASFVLPAKSSITISASIDVGRSHGPQITGTRCHLNPSIEFVFEDNRSQVFEFSGERISAFSVPQSIKLATPIRDHEISRSHRFKFERDPMVSSVRIDCEPSDGIIDLLETASELSIFEFELTPRQRAMLGPFSFVTKITATANGGKSFEPIELTFSGIMVADIDWLPKQIILVQSESNPTPSDQVVFWCPSGAPPLISKGRFGSSVDLFRVPC